MRKIFLTFLVFASLSVSLFAAPPRSLTLTVQSNTDKSTYSYSLKKFLSDPTLPIYFRGRSLVMKVSFSPDEDKEKILMVSLEDLAALVPGGAGGSGYAKTILSLQFPYSTAPIEIYRTSDETMILQVTEEKQ